METSVATLNQLIESHKDRIIACLREMVRIRSVEDRPQAGMPFGPGVDMALERALEMGRKLGFSVKNVDHYAGHIQIGKGEKTIGILVHLDVVPEGEGWTHPPFSGKIYNGRIYGRGSLDNKGPFAACLYAMKAISDSGLPLGKKIRMILGTNEETRWEGITHYLKKEPAPEMSIVPDGNFPVLIGEKGILNLDLKRPLPTAHPVPSLVKSICGGNALNVVPDQCTAVLANGKDLVHRIESHMAGSGEPYDLKVGTAEIILKIKGKASHACTPEKGINAISRTIGILGHVCPPDDGHQDFFRWYNAGIGMNSDGRDMGCAMKDDLSGPLTLNVGRIDLNALGVTLGVDIRYPLNAHVQLVMDRINTILAGSGVTASITDQLPPIHFTQDHFLIKTLLSVYQQETGDYTSEPLVIGGGTYARAVPNAVAFGPEFPGSVTLAHQKDENISISDLMKCARIFTQCLYRLAKEA